MSENTLAKNGAATAFRTADGYIDGAVKDKQNITADWEFSTEFIDGVQLKEVKNVLKPSGDRLVELFRRDWELDSGVVDQVFQSTIMPGNISAWHAHQHTTDRLFVSSARMKVVLYDAREASPTFGRLNEFRLGASRPGLLVIPPGVWHGVKNIGEAPGILVNLVDRAYQYTDPDHWRLPVDTDKIPYDIVGAKRLSSF